MTENFSQKVGCNHLALNFEEGNPFDAQTVDFIYDIIAGGNGQGLANIDDFGALTDELEKSIISEEMGMGMQIDNGEVELNLGDVSFNSGDDEIERDTQGQPKSTFDAEVDEAKDAVSSRMMVTNILEGLATLQQKLSDLS